MKKLLIGLMTMMMLFGACARADYLMGRTAKDAGNHELAMRYWTEAAEQGDARSAKALGDWYKMHRNGPHIEYDYATALEWYMKAAELGDADAMTDIGIIYCSGGHGVEKSYAMALEWHLKAVEYGQKEFSPYAIGSIYKNGGYGVEQSYAKALEWYMKAAELGNGRAMCVIGDFYRNGWIVEADEEEAKQWKDKAAENGHLHDRRCK